LDDTEEHHVELGYSLSGEEHRPLDLVEHAHRAEEVGFPFALISDHFHPWIDRQGQSPFVWSVIGGIAMTTDELELGTGVTCPLLRIHPAIVAHAAATAASLMPGRFFLGIGTGENLNEHILGHRWPPAEMRLDMLEEAVQLMRLLWKGDLTTFRGDHYRVENARVYTLPDEPIRVFVAASGEKAAKLAGQIGDGLISTAPESKVINAYEQAGGEGPKLGQLTVCWAETEAEARKLALDVWPNAGLKGPLAQELPLPSHFEAAAQMVDDEAISQAVVCGPDSDRHLAAIEAFVSAGFDRVYVHQVGPDQDGFFRFYEREVLPKMVRFGDNAQSRQVVA
jgi:coenzyme F420-dependent glucose-6-phosphate dehydrogenase